MSPETTRSDYLSDVFTTLAECVARGIPIHIESHREGDQLVIRTTIDDAEAFHAELSARMAKRVSQDADS